MKWIKASKKLSGHYENVCCRRIGEGFWFTAAYDYSKKMYLPKNASGLMFHKPEDIEWLDESETESPLLYSLKDMEKELKEIDKYLDDLCLQTDKDAGNLWIQFSDKFQAFKKKLLTPVKNK